MNTLYRYRVGLLLIMSVLATGCASHDIKPHQVFCPLLGAALGAGVVAGGLGGDEGGAMAGGAVAGAALGHFLCLERKN